MTNTPLTESSAAPCCRSIDAAVRLNEDEPMVDLRLEGKNWRDPDETVPITLETAAQLRNQLNEIVDRECAVEFRRLRAELADIRAAWAIVANALVRAGAVLDIGPDPGVAKRWAHWIESMVREQNRLREELENRERVEQLPAQQTDLPQLDDLPAIDITGGMPPEIYVGLLRGHNDEAVEWLQQEVARLKGVIAQHDLCHDLHGKVDARAFADGCAAEQRKLYDCAPDADRVQELEQTCTRLRAALRGMEIWRKRCVWLTRHAYSTTRMGSIQRSWVVEARIPYSAGEAFWQALDARMLVLPFNDEAAQVPPTAAVADDRLQQEVARLAVELADSQQARCELAQAHNELTAAFAQLHAKLGAAGYSARLEVENIALRKALTGAWLNYNEVPYDSGTPELDVMRCGDVTVYGAELRDPHVYCMAVQDVDALLRQAGARAVIYKPPGMPLPVEAQLNFLDWVKSACDGKIDVAMGRLAEFIPGLGTEFVRLFSGPVTNETTWRKPQETPREPHDQGQ